MPVFRFKYNGTSRQAKRSIAYVLRSLVGFKTGDSEQKKSAAIRGRVFTRLGNRLLTLIHNEFIIKSLGGQGLDGSRWQPLSPVTIQLKAMKIKSTNRVRRKVGLPPIKMPHSGFQSAMGRLVLEEILVETGVLQKSLSPPKDRSSRRPPFQVFEYGMTFFKVGTCAPNKQWHNVESQYIRPKKLPYRPFWPRQLHQAWWTDLIAELQFAIMDEVRKEMRTRQRSSDYSFRPKREGQA